MVTGVHQTIEAGLVKTEVSQKKLLFVVCQIGNFRFD